MAALSPGDIASPILWILRRQPNAEVLLAEVREIDRARQRLILTDGELSYDYLIVASGATHAYFGHNEWRMIAPGLKTLEDALDIRRRVLIARALVTRPDALVLDEPTTGLDLVARHRFMETVRRLMREGTTLILITHHVDEIAPETRRVVLLRDGQVAYDGRPDDALTAGHLSQTFGANLTVERAGDYYHVRVAGT